MKIAIVGASGKIGSGISAEAFSQGHSVTGIARNPIAGNVSQSVIKSIFLKFTLKER
jgi:putative NADH-flavin reductase